MAEVLEYRGYQISVTARQIPTGAWVPHIDFRRGGVPLEVALPETTQPEWLTEAEALRSAVERAQHLIDRGDLPAASSA